MFSVPFDIFNSETGMIVFGERLENTLTSEIQMTPVSSSNVKASGQSGNSMYVQFLNKQGTYKYTFADPKVATEATMSLLNSSSPGRWVWENLRGHKAGEPIPKTKMGPSITSGVPTIGGTTASLIQYELLGRTPVSRVKGFDEMAKQMRRKTSNPSLDPNTGSRLEGLLGARKGFRELGLKIKQDFKRVKKRKILVGSKVMKGKYKGNINNFTLQKVLS